MKKIIALIISAFLFGVVPAQAQIFAGQYGPADQLIAANQNMVWRFMNGNWYAGLLRGNQFHALYDRTGRRLSRPVKVAIAGAELGATIGYAKGGGKGALIGAGLGAAPGLIAWALSKGGNDDEMIVLPDQIPPMPQTAQAPSSRENGWNDRLRDQANTGNSWFGSQSSCREQGMFVLKNESGEAIKVFQDGQPFGVLQPRKSICATPLLDGEIVEYEADMVVAVSDGFTARAQVVRAKPEGRPGGIWVWR